MTDFEKLGVFYLGRKYDAATGQTTDVPVLYDSRDLVTHALAVGMTGSGKTGLGIALIEEAAIDGVPVIVIDPKGDLSNLLLTFPQLRGSDFEPWVNEDDAVRAGKSRSDFAADEAAKWAKGLAAWGQDGARIQRLRDAADFALYTPGSTTGTPVSVLGSFAAPASDDDETTRDRVQTTVSSLLSLVGIEADPRKSREHILLSAVLGAAWQAGKSPDLATLVGSIQDPPMTRVGVIDVDSFFPPKDRFELAMAINALLASPGFDIWMQGEALDVGAMLRTAAGKPRVAIFSIAHLDDSQRMFFVSMLLNAVTGWMRSQSGTSSLRAIVYMDEIFGYFPPVANPPSKLPLLTLLKQGRAAGLGVVLATQNPADLDYKGLSNIGTWWIGRLQTDRDKQRVMDGLESAGAGAELDRAELDRLLSGLRGRVFLMRNVHDSDLELFESRWAMSYLRGPLAREEIRTLAAASQSSMSSKQDGPVAASVPDVRHAAVPGLANATSSALPILPPDVRQFFAPDAAGDHVLRPILYGAAEVRFVDRKLRVDTARPAMFAANVTDTAIPVDWSQAVAMSVTTEELETQAPAGAIFEPLPAPMTRLKNYTAWSRDLAEWLCSSATLELFISPATGEASQVDESERDFRARLQHSSRETRDAEVDALRKRYAAKLASLEDKRRRAEQAIEREAEQASSHKTQTAISVGATILGALFGGRTSALGRATTAARGVGRAMKESGDVARAKETLAAVEAQCQALQDEIAAETAAIEARTEPGLLPLDVVVLRPKKTHVSVKLVALVWMPATSAVRS